MRGSGRISTGKAIQRRGSGHSVNRRNLKNEKVAVLIPFPKLSSEINSQFFLVSEVISFGLVRQFLKHCLKGFFGLSAGLAEIMATTGMTKTTGIQGANHGFPNNGFRNTRLKSKLRRAKVTHLRCRSPICGFLCVFCEIFRFSASPAIEKIQSRLIAWNFQSIRLKVSIQDWKFQSRLKVSISLENFNPDLDNSPQQEPYFQSRLKISISIENFNLRLVAWKFQSRSEILNWGRIYYWQEPPSENPPFDFSDGRRGESAKICGYLRKSASP